MEPKLADLLGQQTLTDEELRFVLKSLSHTIKDLEQYGPRFSFVLDYMRVNLFYGYQLIAHARGWRA